MGWGCIFIGFLGQLAIYIIHSCLDKVGNPKFGKKKMSIKKAEINYIFLPLVKFRFSTKARQIYRNLNVDLSFIKQKVKFLWPS